MNYFTYIFLSLSIIYSILAILFLIGTFKLPSKKIGKKGKKSPLKEFPFVTVIVAARDEEKCIKDCILSLMNQTYPLDKYQLIIVNDRSEDHTVEIIEGLKADFPQLEIITITEDPIKYSGKQNALMEGYKYAKGEIILNTDADCRVPETWIEKHISDFATSSDIGMVAGFTQTTTKGEKNSLFNKIQSLDLIFLETIAAGCAGLKHPLSCIGNNISYRKSSYDEVGGFEKIGFTVTEDTALLRAIADETDKRVIFSIGKESVVRSYGVPNLSALFHQRNRWMLGGYKTKMTLLGILAITFLSHLAFWISLIVIWFSPLKIILLSAIFLIFLLDFFIILRGCSIVERYDLLPYYILYELFYLAYTVFFGFLAIFYKKEIVWKGRQYKTESN